MKLELTEQEINYIYSLLLEQKAKEVRGLLSKLEVQVAERQAERQEEVVVKENN